jgi:hypothetical protein
MQCHSAGFYRFDALLRTWKTWKNASNRIAWMKIHSFVYYERYSLRIVVLLMIRQRLSPTNCSLAAQRIFNDN